MAKPGAASAVPYFGKFGKLWGRSHETFDASVRRILSVKGESATPFLQGLVTSDVTQDKPPAPGTQWPLPKLQHDPNADKGGDDDEPEVVFNPHLSATCFLQNKGRIVTDALLWKQSADEYLIDVPTESADELLAHLKQFKLRRTKVTIEDVSSQVSSHVIYGTLQSAGAPPGYLAGLDPRHPSLGMRVLSLEHPPTHLSSLVSSVFSAAPGTYNVLRKLSGIAEGVELRNKTALECNQEWLNAVNFHKGCYVGQELTARSQYTGMVRKRVMPLILTDKFAQVPRPWIVAHQVQEGTRHDQVMMATGMTQMPPPLPPLSGASVGGMWTMMAGGYGNSHDQTNTDQAEETAETDKDSPVEMNAMQELVEKINSIAKPGKKIFDKDDGKTIGQIVAAPANGTSVILAQMRLDRVGLTETKTPWKRTNKIMIEGAEEEEDTLRYLPYVPLWGPTVDP